MKGGTGLAQDSSGSGPFPYSPLSINPEGSWGSQSVCV